jgi:hypothetical protein
MELDILASEAGWATDRRAGGRLVTRRPVPFALVPSRLLQEMSRKHRNEDRVDRALGIVKAFSIPAPGEVQLNLDVDAVAGVPIQGIPNSTWSTSSARLATPPPAPPCSSSTRRTTWTLPPRHSVHSPRSSEPARPICPCD